MRASALASRYAARLVGSTWAVPCRQVGPAPRKLITISEERLQQFLHAEVSAFSNRQSKSMTLKDVLEATQPIQAANMACNELPIRFAQRIRQIEELPTWQESPQLVAVCDAYTASFRDVRMLDLRDRGLTACTGMIAQLKQRMRDMVPLLSTAMVGMQQKHGYPEKRVNEWLDAFLLSRIGTDMLTSHYLACVHEPCVIRGPARRGIVDDSCDPVYMCEKAARLARNLCREHFGANCNVQIIIESHGYGENGHDRRRLHFPYVPQYLFYIMLELLKNSARATVESAGRDPAEISGRPIVVTVGADAVQVVIRVADAGGGIPANASDRVWSYMYTTTRSGGSALVPQGTPLAGYGVGLPLSRLHAWYLGGSLHLVLMPGVGTTAYLTLRRSESDAREWVPPAASLADQ